MSVTALRQGAVSAPRLRQAALALAALLLVGGAAAFVVWLTAPVAPPPPARNPFGIGVREAAPAAGGWLAQVLAWQAAFFVQLRSALSALKAGGEAWTLLLGLGFAYGVFHAAGPGHGKAVIASYIVSSERALRRGILLSAAAALVQALVAIALVGAIFWLLGGTAVALSATARAVETGGFALVCLLGLLVLWRKAGALLARLDPRLAPIVAPDCDHCAPLDAGDGAGRFRDALAVALAAGIRPCAGAIVVLTFAAAQGLQAAGIAAVLAMAAGTAITTSLLAALAVFAKRTALRLAAGSGPGPLGPGLELFAAAGLVIVGLALLTGSWSSGI